MKDKGINFAYVDRKGGSPFLLAGIPCKFIHNFAICCPIEARYFPMFMKVQNITHKQTLFFNDIRLKIYDGTIVHKYLDFAPIFGAI